MSAYVLIIAASCFLALLKKHGRSSAFRVSAAKSNRVTKRLFQLFVGLFVLGCFCICPASVPRPLFDCRYRLATKLVF